MKDVTIMYQGGSGGFALYYYLLLSGQYQYDIPTVQSMIAQQFPKELATNPGNWKNKEFWPDNLSLKKTTGPKLFLICNPLFNPKMYEINQTVSRDTYKILLYTDIHLQLRMAWDKQAYWFTKVSREYFNAPSTDTPYIRHILDTAVDNYDPMVSQIKKLFNPNLLVCLEEFVKLKKITDSDTPTQEQREFLKYWKSIQSAKSLRLIESQHLDKI